MALARTTTGKKMLMAVSGHVMIIFTVAHLLGNLTIYFGQIDAYAERLNALMPVIWLIRAVMLAALVLHVYLAIVLTIDNYRAKPQGYAVRANLRSTFSSRTMIWSGAIILAYLIFHIMHFTLHFFTSISEPSAGMYLMILAGLGNSGIFLVYVLSLSAVFMHLWHGVQSSFQSLGLSNESLQPVISRAGAIASIAIFSGYASIPISVILGLLRS